MNREELFDYVKKTYDTLPDYPWREEPDYAVLRHGDDQKWYGLVMYLQRSKLGLPMGTTGNPKEDTWIDVLNVKVDPALAELLRETPGIRPAYHMNRQHWITILLDGSCPDDLILDLLDDSFAMTASKKEKEKYGLFPKKDWLIPANPKYYDVIHAFDDTDTILWKQGAAIHVGDEVFLYVAAPYSSIMFQCKVTETDIPYRSKNSVNMKTGMMIHLERRFEQGQYSFDVLKQFGVYAVRGPRSLPASLREEIDRE